MHELDHMAEIWVLRLGHRPERDKRITTHVALTARAFGAKDKSGTKDASLEESVNDVVKRFGGDFSIESGVNWRRFLTSFKSRGKVAHLTMYGLQVDDVVPRTFPLHYDLSIVVGGKRCRRKSIRPPISISRRQPAPLGSGGTGDTL